MKKGFALIAALAIGSAAFAMTATTADAKSKKTKRTYAVQQPYWNANGWDQPRVHGRRDPSSYDGIRTGNPRTCGSDFFRYDDRGVPMGPYCN